MKKLFLSLLLLTACEGGTVHLDSTGDVQQRESALCASWDTTFCGSGLPAESALEAIRLLDEISVDLFSRVDLACTSVLDSAHVASTPADLDHPELLLEHCRLAHDFLATFVDDVAVVPATCTPAPIGCAEFPLAAQTCTGGSVSVVDKTGTHATEAVVARKALDVTIVVKDHLDSITALTGTLSSSVGSVAQLDPACTNGAVERTGNATQRISRVIEAAAALSDL